MNTTNNERWSPDPRVRMAQVIGNAVPVQTLQSTVNRIAESLIAAGFTPEQVERDIADGTWNFARSAR